MAQKWAGVGWGSRHSEEPIVELEIPFESAQAGRPAARHSCGWDGQATTRMSPFWPQGWRPERQERVSAERGVWVAAPYGFALRVTQPGQPVKLFKTNDTDPGKSYLRTLHRATARGEWGAEQQARETWKPAGAVPPAHSFGGLVAGWLTPGPAVRVCPRRKQLAASDQKLLLPRLAPLAPLPPAAE